MSRRQAFAWSAFTVALTAALAGCGSEFRLPTETRGIEGFPSDGSYKRIADWPGMAGVSDVLLTQGRGSQLFIAFKSSASGVARVVEYALKSQAELDYRITDVISPSALAFHDNHLFVLDQGDTASARVTQPSYYEADCGPLAGFRRPIVDLSSYWRVREYDLDGDTVSTFTDTTLAFVSGLAVDTQGRVYVSGVLMHCDVNPFDSRLKTLDFEYRIFRYIRGGSDPDLPGAAWHRDRSYELTQGTGIGSTVNPGRMTWDGFDGGALFFADRGNNEVQKFADPGGVASSFKIDEGDSLLIQAPVDVALDRQGFIYLVDGGRARVLRYDSQGEFVQRVDFDIAIPAPPLAVPVAVAADDSLVYVADSGASMVIRYQRR